MTDYHYEQKSEVEALESIYYGDLQVLETQPFYKMCLLIKSEGFDQGDGVSCRLTFTHCANYPDDVPTIEVDNEVNFEGNIDKAELLAFLEQQAKMNIGMAMVFTLVSEAQDWLNDKYDKKKKEKHEQTLAKQRADEEAELKRFEGTRVTVESFLAWRTQFAIDMGISAKKEREAKDKNKITGKELFMRDATLNESDLKFLDDGDAVKVDESLFQDLDDLDLSDEEDADYRPVQIGSESDSESQSD